MSYAHVQDQWLAQDPELRHSLRVIRRQHTWRLIGVVVALVAALATAAAYTYLSYSDVYDTQTGQQ